MNFLFKGVESPCRKGRKYGIISWLRLQTGASFGMPVFADIHREEMRLTLREEAPMSKDDARRLNPLQLAYIGDTVYDDPVAPTVPGV